MPEYQYRQCRPSSPCPTLIADVAEGEAAVWRKNMNRNHQKTADDVRLSRFIAKVLRHQPQIIGLNIDHQGWADVAELLKKARKPELTREVLERIVRQDEKGRYELDETGNRIRACQGHSLQVDAGQERKPAPEVLYHGTARKSAASIENQGLVPMSRLFVHLSPDVAAAMAVGKRHGKPVVYRVDTKQMEKDGYVFYQARNGVWLTETVPPRYLERMDVSTGTDHS